MFSPLGDVTYRRLFLAQLMALLGTGLATIALGLLAHEIAGASSGEILGVVLAIKMIAYVGVAPFASALASALPRKTLLISLDVVRAAVAAAMPFVTEAWQVYGLMTVLYMASAAFTPAFQSMIPEILEDEQEYTKALSLSRLASDLESVASPFLAALLLTVVSYNNLFAGTSIGFFASALLVLSAALPVLQVISRKSFFTRLTVGFRLFALTPRLRGLLAISMATAAGGAMVFVNTVVIVQSQFDLGQEETAWALFAFGCGSMLAALLTPTLLGAFSDRILLSLGGLFMAIGLITGSIHHHGDYRDFLLLWFSLGVGYSLTVTPAGRVLRRSSSPEDRPALFAAYFALSHACWLVTYPLAGLLSARVDIDTTFVILGVVCAVGAVLGFLLWPAHDPDETEHAHPKLTPDHPHLGGKPHEHSHPLVIDDLHPHWPRSTD